MRPSTRAPTMPRRRRTLPRVTRPYVSIAYRRVIVDDQNVKIGIDFVR
jgi:hypothetical protein